MKLRTLALSLIAAAMPLLAQASSSTPVLLAGVSDVQFSGGSEQRFLGSGFVLEHQGRLYGVTAKHVLLMHKGAPLANTDIQTSLQHWRLRDPRSQEVGTVKF